MPSVEDRAGVAEMVLNSIAEHVLGLPRSY